MLFRSFRAHNRRPKRADGLAQRDLRIRPAPSGAFRGRQSAQYEYRPLHPSGPGANPTWIRRTSWQGRLRGARAGVLDAISKPVKTSPTQSQQEARPVWTHPVRHARQDSRLPATAEHRDGNASCRSRCRGRCPQPRKSAPCRGRPAGCNAPPRLAVSLFPGIRRGQITKIGRAHV